MQTTKMISIAEHFSKTPSGRYAAQHRNSGEAFRDQLLIPALRNGDVTVDLDGTMGYGSSFLEEAFGGLIRQGVPADDVRNRLHIQTTMPVYKERVWRYIEEAANRVKRR